jgi:hypothetical protein
LRVTTQPGDVKPPYKTLSNVRRDKPAATSSTCDAI